MGHRHPANARRALHRVPTRRPKDAAGLVRLHGRVWRLRPGYIGTSIAYRKAATKPVLATPVSRVSPRVEAVLMTVMQELLASKPAAQLKPFVASATEAKDAFSSPEALTKLLERRWPISAINTFCIPEWRHNDARQNLVADTKVVWKGTLHPNVKTGYDRIEWYATTEKGRAKQYSLNVSRGDDFWHLEGGDQQTVQHASKIAPNPRNPWFVGKK